MNNEKKTNAAPSFGPDLFVKAETLQNFTIQARIGAGPDKRGSAVSDCGCKTNGTNQAQCCT